MKLFTVCAVLASLILGNAAWSAQQTTEPTAEQSLLAGARIVTQIRAGQQAYCEKPRSNSTEKCNRDFDDAAQYEIQFTVRHVLYLTAYHGNAGAKELKYLKAEKDKSLKELLKRTDVLDRDYVPVKTSDATQKK